VTAKVGASSAGGSDAAGFRSWIGREETVAENLSPFPTAALQALLDRDEPHPQSGQALPPLAHWLHFLPIHRQSELAEDGHVRRGGFLPPLPYPRRMFAGARISFERPLRIGEPARRTGTVTDVVEKQGRTGRLAFVSVRQEIRGEQGLALTEEQDIVYRTAPVPGQPPAVSRPAPGKEQWGRDLVPDSAMLFRYSALLFNAHRIHYDWRYVTEIEGYPGLVVHGQLVATFLADLARQETGLDLASFSYRSLEAFFAGGTIRLSGRRDGNRVQLWASHAGGIGTVAEASLATRDR
jgi:3-methylfumaryl-CoA hydratase